MCSIEHSKTPQDVKTKTSKKNKKIKMKGIIHKQKEHEKQKQKNIDGKKPWLFVNHCVHQKT